MFWEVRRRTSNPSSLHGCPYASTCLQVGQLLLFCRSHTSTQAVWKKWPHGSVRTSSPRTNSSRQIWHWMPAFFSENVHTRMALKASSLVLFSPGSSSSSMQVASRSKSKARGFATSSGVKPSLVKTVTLAAVIQEELHCLHIATVCCLVESRPTACWLAVHKRRAGKDEFPHTIKVEALGCVEELMLLLQRGRCALGGRVVPAGAALDQWPQRVRLELHSPPAAAAADEGGGKGTHLQIGCGAPPFAATA
eukprot:CAMPEP_0171059854 /NCGR_PEP_ID=MMETSP0766_2-20121228/3456_1 /TAXON_ID=439317 /ORGANISM="Gambierdiscus australes, Strain CAWD 149" /LENGTH=250 /DNA_ID=CAMNT_0011515355 /DNA_START=64 /DNA_END=812 /DNA_ORIENTATION=-